MATISQTGYDTDSLKTGIGTLSTGVGYLKEGQTLFDEAKTKLSKYKGGEYNCPIMDLDLVSGLDSLLATLEDLKTSIEQGDENLEDEIAAILAGLTEYTEGFVNSNVNLILDSIYTMTGDEALALYDRGGTNPFTITQLEDGTFVICFRGAGTNVSSCAEINKAFGITGYCGFMSLASALSSSLSTAAGEAVVVSPYSLLTAVTDYMRVDSPSFSVRGGIYSNSHGFSGFPAMKIVGESLSGQFGVTTLVYSGDVSKGAVNDMTENGLTFVYSMSGPSHIQAVLATDDGNRYACNTYSDGQNWGKNGGASYNGSKYGMSISTDISVDQKTGLLVDGNGDPVKTDLGNPQNLYAGGTEYTVTKQEDGTYKAEEVGKIRGTTLEDGTYTTMGSGAKTTGSGKTTSTKELLEAIEESDKSDLQAARETVGETSTITQAGVVGTKETALNVRTDPSRDSSSIKQIDKGDTIYLTGNSKVGDDGTTWVEVQTEDGKTGWSDAKYVKDVVDLNEPKVQTAGGVVSGSDSTKDAPIQTAGGEVSGSDTEKVSFKDKTSSILDSVKEKLEDKNKEVAAATKVQTAGGVVSGSDSTKDTTIQTAGGAVSGTDSTKDTSSKIPTLEELKAMKDSGMTNEEIQAEVQKQTGVTPTEKVEITKPIDDATKSKVEATIKDMQTKETKVETAGGVVSGSDQTKDTPIQTAGGVVSGTDSSTDYTGKPPENYTIEPTDKTNIETAGGVVSGTDATKTTPIQTAGGVVSGTDSSNSNGGTRMSDLTHSDTKLGRVTTQDPNSNLRIHSTPDTDASSRTGDVIKSGSDVTIIGEENGMYKVKLDDGTEGYVSSKYVIAGTETKTDTSTKIVNTEYTGLGVHSSNDSGDSNVTGSIPRGTELTLLDEDSSTGMSYVEDSSGKRFYVKTEYLADTYQNGDTAIVKTKDVDGRLNVRTGNSTNTDVIETIPRGTEVTIIDKDAGNGMVKIEYDGKTGYVSKQYLGL